MLVCLAVPDRDWVRHQLREILRVGLNEEGVIFAFNLPALLLAETQSEFRVVKDTWPGRQSLETYLNTALHRDDRWGTAMRARNAAAAALFWQGDAPGAWGELLAASARATGFAGYGSMAFLLLANRCGEFGEPERAQKSEWGPSGDDTLFDLANREAYKVQSQEFQEERKRLVATRTAWEDEDTADVEQVMAHLAEMLEPDFRRVYKDLAAARWVDAGGPGSQMALGKLALSALNDGTTLDGVLARLLAPLLKDFSDDDLVEAIELCARYFNYPGPWEFAAGSYA